MKSKGVTLILILGLISTVLVLANIALMLIRSHFEFTHHQVSRIQGFYAAQAGMNYALERLRLGDPAWTPGVTKTLCNNSSCDVEDTDILYPVVISIGPAGTGIDNTTPVNATVNY